MRRGTGGHDDADCRYRILYEGSQASLSDMASQQAGALNRVARLRSGVVAALKQTFPNDFRLAETSMGSRMSSAVDEVLLAFLNGFLALPSRRTAANFQAMDASAPLHLDLIRALQALGVNGGDHLDTATWTAAVLEAARGSRGPTCGGRRAAHRHCADELASCCARAGRADGLRRRAVERTHPCVNPAQ